MRGLRWTDEQLAAFKKPAVRNKHVTLRQYPTVRQCRTGLGLRLPFPPTVNHSSGPTAGGGKYLTAAHRSFRLRVAAAVLEAGKPYLEGRLSVEITVCPPNRRRFDLDNRLKAILDALQHAGVYDDDEQIDELTIRRGAIGGNDSFVTINRIMT